MNKNRASLLILLFGFLFFYGTKALASEQPNFDSDEKTVVFHLDNSKGGGSNKQTQSGFSQNGGAFSNKQPSSQNWSMLPKTNDTKMMLLSFIGTLLVGLVLLILLGKRRKQDETENH